MKKIARILVPLTFAIALALPGLAEAFPLPFRGR